MKKLVLAVTLAVGVVGSVAFAMKAEQPVDNARVAAKIDARLHELLVQARAKHSAHRR